MYSTRMFLTLYDSDSKEMFSFFIEGEGIPLDLVYKAQIIDKYEGYHRYSIKNRWSNNVDHNNNQPLYKRLSSCRVSSKKDILEYVERLNNKSKEIKDESKLEVGDS